ncbi:MAG: hypothetical protein M1305_00405 [Candidatus Marsarchaeota archaeon]|nr:hypothetical protein [Candidatus Marsarchaeota archaeon]
MTTSVDARLEFNIGLDLMVISHGYTRPVRWTQLRLIVAKVRIILPYATRATATPNVTSYGCAPFGIPLNPKWLARLTSHQSPVRFD